MKTAGTRVHRWRPTDVVLIGIGHGFWALSFLRCNGPWAERGGGGHGLSG